MLQQLWKILGFDFESKIHRQQKRNLSIISRIIDGHYKRLDPGIAEASKKAFSEWMIQERELWQKAGDKAMNALVKARRKGDHHAFNWKVAISRPSGRPFIADAFTEPFPSLHDMDDWAMSTKMAELLIAHGIRPGDQKPYTVFVRHHFVNHKMVQAIIQFDVYRYN